MFVKKISSLIVILVLSSLFVTAQTKAEKQVATVVSQLIKAMEDGSAPALDRITAAKLSYGHSSGKVENKADFLQAFKSGASDFIKINISDQTIEVVKKTAIVRHTLEADTNDNNKPGHVKLKVMTVWQKQGGQWKMIARQAVKSPVS